MANAAGIIIGVVVAGAAIWVLTDIVSAEKADDDAPAVDCIVSSWGDWSTCVDSKATRSRTVLTDKSGAGASCPPLTQTQECTCEGEVIGSANCLPSDCVVGEWGNWSSCVSGEQHREREVTTIATNGGSCDDVLREERNCHEDCEHVWDTDGSRKPSRWYGPIASLSARYRRNTCDLNGVHVKAYTDREYYLPGETINLLLFKQLYETSWWNDWGTWGNTFESYGEGVDLHVKLEGINTNHTLVNDWDGVQPTINIATIGDKGEITSSLISATAPPGGGQKEKWKASILSITIPDDDNVADTYKLTLKAKIGPYQFGSFCNTQYPETTGHSKTPKILPSVCKTPPPSNSSAESYEVQSFKSESHQSFMTEWV